MSLEIIGAGFGRTGTLSTQHALNELGYRSYHMFEVLRNSENKTHLDFWKDVANSQPGVNHPWEEVFANYTATVDNPGCCVWRELMETYPDARILLTLHPGGPDAWYDSTRATIHYMDRAWQGKVLAAVIPRFRKILEMSRKLIWQRSHKGTLDISREAAIQRYQEHIDEVKAAVPPEKLLIFQVNQGWGPLAEFLGKEVPDKPFPRVNDRKEIKKTITMMTAMVYFILLAGVGVVAAIIYAIMQLVG